jgi:predicted dehydrogenase
MSNTLNIGLIGAGFMGQTHADSYRRAGILYRNLPRTPVLYAVAEQNDKLAEQARGRLGFQKAYGDWRKLIEDPEVDVVDITTPNHLHVEPALAALEAGKHVYCEKPMAVKVEDAQRMAAAARKAGGKTLVAFNNIKTPAALVAKQIIERGEIGELTRFRGRCEKARGRKRRSDSISGKVRVRGCRCHRGFPHLCRSGFRHFLGNLGHRGNNL